MPRIIELPSRGITVEFSDRATDEQIQDFLDREYPRSGQDVAYELGQDPKFHRSTDFTLEDYEMYRDYMSTAAQPGAFEQAYSYLSSTVKGAAKEAISNIVNPNPIDGLKILGTGIAAGTGDLVDLTARAFEFQSAEDTYQKHLEENKAADSESERKKYLGLLNKDYRDFKRQMDYQGFRQKIVDASPAPYMTEAASLVADPSVFITGGTSAIGKTGAKLVTKAGAKLGTGVRKVGQTADKLGMVPERIAGAVAGEGAEDFVRGATTVGAGAVGLGTGIGAGYAVPGALKAGGRTLNVAGDMIEATAEAAQRGGRRGVLDQASELAETAAGQKLLSGLSRIETPLAYGVEAGKGALYGGAIGGGLGFVAEGKDGFFHGLAMGSMMGAPAGVLGRGIADVTGFRYAGMSRDDAVKYLSSRPDAEFAVKALDRMSAEDAALIGDAVELGRQYGVRVEFHDDSQRPVGLDPSVNHTHYKGVEVGPDGVYINTDRMDGSTVAHEVFHSIGYHMGREQFVESIKGILIGQRDPVSGNLIREGDVPVETLKQFGRAYAAQFSNRARQARLKGKSEEADTLDRRASEFLNQIEAGDYSKVIDEFGAYYFDAFVRGEEPKILIGGEKDLVKNTLSWAKKKMAANFQRDIARQGMDFSQGVGAAFIRGDRRQFALPAFDKLIKRMIKDGSVDTTHRVPVTGIPTKEAYKLAQMHGAAHLFELDASGEPIGAKTKGDLDAEFEADFDKVLEQLERLPSAVRRSRITEDAKGRKKLIAESITPEEAVILQDSIRHLNPYQRQMLMDLANGMTGDGGKQTYRVSYWKASGASRSKRKPYDQFEVSEREVLPYSLEMNKTGGLYFRFVDMDVVRGNLRKATRLSEYKNLYPNFKELEADFLRYLENLDSESPADSAAFLGGGETGVAKRNLFYEGLGIVPRKDVRLKNLAREGYTAKRGRSPSIKSFRIERVGNMTPTGERVAFSDSRAYERGMENLMPDDGTVRAEPDQTFKLGNEGVARFMPANDRVDLADYADRNVIALAADRMGIGVVKVGPTGAKRELSIPAQGGRGFMNIFNGGGWAFSDQATASRFLKRLKEDADENGNAVVGITVQSQINHLKNQTGQLAYVEAMQAAIDAGAISKRAADSQVRAMSDAVLASEAASIKQTTKQKFRKIRNLSGLERAVKNKALNFADMEPLLKQMQRKALPIKEAQLKEIGMTAPDIARDIADPELADIPFGSVVALLEVNVKQTPEKNNFHHSYPYTVHGNALGYLNRFHNIADLSTEPRIRNKHGVSAQPLQTVMPVMDNILKTVETKEGIPADPAARFMPDVSLRQKYTSKGTSLEQIPAVMKSKFFIEKAEGTNLDIGAGRSMKGTQHLEEMGIENLRYDPFNVPEDVNRKTVSRLQSGERVKTVTVPSVLNTVNEKAVRNNIVHQAARALEKDGTAFFSIYEGNASGKGKPTPRGFQLNRKTAKYVPEIKTWFKDVTVRGNIIIAKSPIRGGKVSWLLNEDGSSARYMPDTGPQDFYNHNKSRMRMLGVPLYPANGVGKKMGSAIYLHKSAEDALPQKSLSNAKSRLPSGWKYDVVKYDKNTKNYTFTKSPDFDTASEPVVGDAYLVKQTGEVKLMPQKKDPQIYHHKWNMVRMGYDGFDVAGSMAHSINWKSSVPKGHSSKIGTKSYFDKLLGDSNVRFQPDIGGQDSLGMFSAAERATVDLKQEKGSASQMLAMIKKAGVKDEEIAELGLDKLLEGNRKVSKDEIVDYLVENQITVEETVLRGLHDFAAEDVGIGDISQRARLRIDNYRDQRHSVEYMREDVDYMKDDLRDYELEGLLKYIDYVEKNGHPEKKVYSPTKFEGYVEPGADEGSYRELLLRLPESPWVNYTGGHYGEHPNVLAHIRFNDRTSEYGKTLFLEEIQSDWHQDGRKKGYAMDAGEVARLKSKLNAEQANFDAIYNRWHQAEPAEVVRLRGERVEAAGRVRRAEEALEAATGSVPDAPFKTSWHELAMKRMISYAAKNGYDAIAWTKGETQANRYGTEEIAWVKTSPKTWEVKAVEQRGGEADGVNIEEAARAQGILKEGGTEVYGPGDLKRLIEKTITSRQRSEFSPENYESHVDKMTNRIWSRMQSEDAGTSLPRKEGMEGFYDRMLPKMKTWKKLGLKVESGDLGGEPGNYDNVNAHIVKLTPEVKAKVLDTGIARFMPDASVPGAEKNSIGWSMILSKAGKWRVYDPSGALAGIAGSKAVAERIFRTKYKRELRRSSLAK